MNWLDILIGLVLIASILGAFRNGLSREVVRLAAHLAAAHAHDLGTSDARLDADSEKNLRALGYIH